MMIILSVNINQIGEDYSNSIVKKKYELRNSDHRKKKEESQKIKSGSEDNMRDNSVQMKIVGGKIK